MADVDDQIIVIAVSESVVEPELEAAVAVVRDADLRRADERLVVAELMERNGGPVWNEDRVPTAVF